VYREREITNICFLGYYSVITNKEPWSTKYQFDQHPYLNLQIVNLIVTKLFRSPQPSITLCFTHNHFSSVNVTIVTVGDALLLLGLESAAAGS
jgi:hypothetical protein